MESTPTRSTRLTTADMILIALAAWILLFGGWETLRTMFTGGTIPGVKGTTTPLSSTPQITILGVGNSPGTGNPGPRRVPPAVRGGGGAGMEVSTPTPYTLPNCATVPDSRTPCVSANAEEAYQASLRLTAQPAEPTQITEQQALEIWQEMSDMCAELGCSPKAGEPTAEVPTECTNPQTPRAIASCDLIKKGVIHPKG